MTADNAGPISDEELAETLRLADEALVAHDSPGAHAQSETIAGENFVEGCVEREPQLAQAVPKMAARIRSLEQKIAGWRERAATETRRHLEHVQEIERLRSQPTHITWDDKGNRVVTHPGQPENAIDKLDSLVAESAQPTRHAELVAKACNCLECTCGHLGNWATKGGRD